MSRWREWKRPKPAKDWTAAQCVNARTPKGPCCFCGATIKPFTGYFATLDGFRAHYNCAPGLGAPFNESEFVADVTAAVKS